MNHNTIGAHASRRTPRNLEIWGVTAKLFPSAIAPNEHGFKVLSQVYLSGKGQLLRSRTHGLIGKDKICTVEVLTRLFQGGWLEKADRSYAALPWKFRLSENGRRLVLAILGVEG